MARLGTRPDPEAVRHVIELVITFWNAKAKASALWNTPRPKALNDLTRKMTGKKASPGDVEAFELLSARWLEKENRYDPRMVGAWSLDAGDDGTPRLHCEMELPAGIETALPPPIEKRVAIGGRFLDETTIRLGGTSRGAMLLSYPVECHRATVSDDGTVTVHATMPTAVALFDEGVLPPMGGASVELTVLGRKFDAMVLSALGCRSGHGDRDTAILVFTAVTGSIDLEARRNTGYTGAAPRTPRRSLRRTTGATRSASLVRSVFHTSVFAH